MVKRIYLLFAIVSALSVGVAVARSVDDQKDQKDQKEQKDKTAKKERAPGGVWVQSDNAPNAFALTVPFGEGSYLGVYLEEINADRVKELGLAEERGALVMKVVEGSPAEKAGLKENDVVVGFNSRRVDSVREFQRLLGETPADRSVAIEVIRGGSHQNFTATLTKRSPNFQNFKMPEINERALLESQEKLKQSQEWLKNFKDGEGKFKLGPEFGNFTYMDGWGLFRGGQLGIGVESLTEQLAQYFGVKDGHGVLVSEVDENGAAAKAGIKAGDVIVAVENEKIDNVGALLNAVGKKTEGPVTIRIVRDRSERTVTVNLEKRPTPTAPRRRASVVTSVFGEA
jgi:C-terminal processing protease CtpA/Prc